jgi:citrate lyase beta subunit
MDQDRIADDIARADEAAFLLSHRLYKEAWQLVEAAIDETYLAANSHDTATMQECHRTRKNLRRLREVFDIAIANGFVAKESLKRSQLEKAREFLGL